MNDIGEAQPDLMLPNEAAWFRVEPPCLRNLWILSCGAISGFGLTGPRAAVLLAPTRIGQQTYLALAKLLRSSRPPGEPCFCRGGA